MSGHPADGAAVVCTHINSMNATPAVESRHLLEILHALTRYIRQVRRLQLHSVAEHLSTAQLRLQDGTCAFIVPARAEGLTLSALSCYTPEKTLPWLLRCSLLRKGERGVVVCKRLELSRFRTPLEHMHQDYSPTTTRSHLRHKDLLWLPSALYCPLGSGDDRFNGKVEFPLNGGISTKVATTATWHDVHSENTRHQSSGALSQNYTSQDRGLCARDHVGIARAARPPATASSDDCTHAAQRNRTVFVSRCVTLCGVAGFDYQFPRYLCTVCSCGAVCRIQNTMLNHTILHLRRQHNRFEDHGIHS